MSQMTIDTLYSNLNVIYTLNVLYTLNVRARHAEWAIHLYQRPKKVYTLSVHENLPFWVQVFVER